MCVEYYIIYYKLMFTLIEIHPVRETHKSSTSLHQHVWSTRQASVWPASTMLWPGKWNSAGFLRGETWMRPYLYALFSLSTHSSVTGRAGVDWCVLSIAKFSKLTPQWKYMKKTHGNLYISPSKMTVLYVHRKTEGYQGLQTSDVMFWVNAFP